jgi:hypothetical protein
MYTAVPSNLRQVLSREMLEHYVKEHELLTAERGREFVVLGAERISYRVGLCQNGYEIRRESDSGSTAHPLLRAAAHDLHKHAIGKAMLSGALFTSALH